MDDTFHHRNNLPHRSHPPGTLLDQFLHLIPAEKNKDFMNIFPKKYLSKVKKLD